MMTRSLQRTIGRELAWRKLKPFGTVGLFHSWFSGPFYGIAEIYIPYRLYRVIIVDRGRESARYFAVDAAAGTLDPYEFDTLPEADSWEEVTSRNCHPAIVEEGETRGIAVAKVRRLLFSRGFFRLASPRIRAELVEGEFYIPYWACFYGDEQNIRVRVLDAVRQTIEGNKVRQLITKWLLQSQAEASSAIPACSKSPL